MKNFSTYIFIIVATVLFSCGKPIESNVSIQNDRGFDDIKLSFLNEANLRGIGLRWQDVDLPIAFAELEDAIGKCFWTSIKIDPSIKRNTSLLEEVVYHELGHCVLGRGHTDGLSLMSTGRTFNFDLNRKLFLDELFLGRKLEFKEFKRKCSHLFGRPLLEEEEFTQYERMFLPLRDAQRISVYGEVYVLREYLEVFTSEECVTHKEYERYEVITVHN